MPSKVYFTDMRATPELNLLQKLAKLIKSAGIEQIDFKKQFTAIKIHLGEPGNIAYLRPNFSKVVADIIKGLGGKPFLTDSNTLYVGRRKDALEHLDAAYENGYNPFCTGCQVIIADGLKGTDEAYIPVKGGEHVKEAKIGRAIADADIIVSLSHFKGHELTGFGGAIKNLGMGSGSRAGKMEMHSDGKPSVDEEVCIGCGRCARNCAQKAISIRDGKACIDHGKCVGCGRCIAACPFDAVQPDWEGSNTVLCQKMAEYAKAVVDGKPSFHISLVIDVSPFCDCHAENDAAVTPDIGFFASFDPVALDQACADAVLGAPAISGTYLADKLHENGADADHFHAMHPDTKWQATLAHAEKLGMGTREYELVEI
ncbi:MAG: DUF362 domain-containing protein [bacterium]|nr:DUF362 domain-containing protein [bacterium]